MGTKARAILVDHATYVDIRGGTLTRTGLPLADPGVYLHLGDLLAGLRRMADQAVDPEAIEAHAQRAAQTKNADEDDLPALRALAEIHGLGAHDGLMALADILEESHGGG